MCGIAGVYTPRRGQSDALAVTLDTMGRAISHRGPDGRGTWLDPDGAVGLVHNRLAIIDLTVAGAQPMVSADGRWVIAFNGEIYNFARIRAEIDREGDAPAWRGHSDTEVLLEAVSRWGVERALRATIGMFAIALWDRRDRRLTLARDRAGEKPLYYGWSKGTLLFGSELKALRAYPSFDDQIDREAVAAYARYGYVPAPRSIYRAIAKLEPGHSISFSDDTHDSSPVPYWTAPVVGAEIGNFTRGEALEELERLLTDSIALQMRADVPMGAFLSGGVDSSTIVALMQRQSIRPVKTFAIGFGEREFNEAEHASRVAAHLGTEHRELYATPDDALNVVPLLPMIYDEPFADSSQVPTFLLSKLTREHVTVSLSGDAGDELFGGYTRYFQSRQFERLWSAPPWARRFAASALRKIPNDVLESVGRFAPGRLSGAFTSGRLPKIAAALECSDIYDVYRRLVSQWKDPLQVVRGVHEDRGWIDDGELRHRSPDVASWMMSVDFRTYLPDDILVKVDRASMAVSLESRVPMLDHRLIEFAATLPLEWKMSKGTGKLLLRDLLYKYVPRSLIERPKQGFGVPIGAWLRGPLRDWAEDLLQPGELAADAFFDVRTVRAAWATHLSGAEDLHYPLWVILMFQAWRRSTLDLRYREAA